MSSTGQLTCRAPIATSAWAVPASSPMVSLGRTSPSTRAAIAGAMQMKPSGLPCRWTALISRSTSAFTDMSAPWVAKVQRFFAAPKPPGKISASSSSAFAIARSSTSQRAMRADSWSTLRVAPATGSPAL